MARPGELVERTISLKIALPAVASHDMPVTQISINRNSHIISILPPFRPFSPPRFLDILRYSRIGHMTMLRNSTIPATGRRQKIKNATRTHGSPTKHTINHEMLIPFRSHQYPFSSHLWAQEPMFPARVNPFQATSTGHSARAPSPPRQSFENA